MNKQRFSIILIFVLFAIYIIAVINTKNKFIQPEQKYYGIDNTAECNGYSYKLLDMENFLLDEFAENYNFSSEEFVFDNCERMYYVAKMEVTKLHNDAKPIEIGQYNKYSSGYLCETLIEDYINEDSVYKKDFKVGETVTYYFVKSLLKHNYKNRTWKSLDESDLWLRIYDNENHCEIYFGTDFNN